MTTQALAASSNEPVSTVTADQILGDETVAPEKQENPTIAKDDRISPKLQMLVQRERAAVERESAAKKREAELEARLKEFEEREARVKEFEAVKSTNPRKALELLGLNYQELTQAELADGNIPAEVQIKRIDDKVEAILKDQEAAQLRSEEAAKKQAEDAEAKAVQDFKSSISEYLKSNPDRYEYISFEQAEDLVFETIDAHYQRTIDPETGIGKVMTKEEAADKVEAYLEKKDRERKSLKKAQALYGQANAKLRPEIQTALKQAQAAYRQTPKTLTNNLSATPTPKPKSGIITDDERIQKAIAYARGLRP